MISSWGVGVETFGDEGDCGREGSTEAAWGSFASSLEGTDGLRDSWIDSSLITFIMFSSLFLTSFGFSTIIFVGSSFFSKETVIIGGPSFFSKETVITGGPSFFSKETVIIGGPSFFSKETVITGGPTFFSSSSICFSLFLFIITKTVQKINNKTCIQPKTI